MQIVQHHLLQPFLLEERLAKYPHLRARFEAILDVAENTSGSLERADDAIESL